MRIAQYEKIVIPGINNVMNAIIKKTGQLIFTPSKEFILFFCSPDHS